MGIETVLTYDEIKGVLHVKEKERETFNQTSDEKKVKNQEKLQLLRSINDELRKEVLHLRNGGRHKVSKIFVTRPNEKPLMKNKDLKTSALLMDQKAFERSRHLGKLNYELEKAKEKLGQKEQILTEIKFQLERNNPCERKVKEYMQAQSRAELVKMKLMDAVNTANCYKKTIHTLQKEIFDTSQKVKTMEKCKAEKTNILNQVQEIRNGADKEFKQVQNQMRPLHAMIESKTREFDDNLRKKRKEHQDQRRDTNTKCLGELKMDVVEDENPEARKAKELAVNIELKSYQDSFEKVKEALDISDVKDVLGRVQEEHSRYKRLCDQLEEGNLLYDTLSADLDDLREQFANLTYNPAPPNMSEQVEQQLLAEAEKQMERVQAAVSRLADKEKIIAGIKLATLAVHSKLIYVRLPAGQPASLVGEPVKDMEVIWNKMEKLMARYGTGNMEEEHHEWRELKKFMELRLPEDNLRTVLRPLDYTSRDDLRYDFDDIQAAYVSRDDIKKRHQEILKPKKRKPPPARKANTRGGKK